MSFVRVPLKSTDPVGAKKDVFLQTRAARKTAMLDKQRCGKIYVGTIARNYGFSKVVAVSDTGAEPILIHSSSSGWGQLSPFHLRTKKEGYLIENFWQFSKLYPRVNKITKKTKFGWEHPAEVHFDGKTPTNEYRAWRAKGFRFPYAVRYPNGYSGKHDVITSIVEGTGECVGYVEARKKIYCQAYIDALPGHSKFRELQEKWRNGANLLILDVDGPVHGKNAPYDAVKQGKLGQPGVGILEITEKNVKAAMANTDAPFGHGWVIATLIMGKAGWLK
jgi:hypothetical protein